MQASRRSKASAEESVGAGLKRADKAGRYKDRGNDLRVRLDQKLRVVSRRSFHSTGWSGFSGGYVLCLLFPDCPSPSSRRSRTCTHSNEPSRTGQQETYGIQGQIRG